MKRPDGTYIGITDIKDLEYWIAYIQYNRILDIGIDTETDSLDYLNCNILGVSLAFSIQDAPNVGLYIPIKQEEIVQEVLWDSPSDYISLEDVVDNMNVVLSDERITKYMHNAKFDLHILERHGFVINGHVFDTMIAAWVLGNRAGNKYGLKYLTKEKLGFDQLEFNSVVGKNKDFSSVDLKTAVEYAGPDGDMTLRLAQLEKSVLKKFPSLQSTFDIETNCIRVLKDMEAVGSLIDTKYLRSVGRELGRDMYVLEESLESFLGGININSEKQLKETLQKKFDLNLDNVTAETIKTVAKDIPELNDLMVYRKKAKLKSVYCDGLLKLVDNNGYLHTSFYQMLKTGRLSCVPLESEILTKNGWKLHNEIRTGDLVLGFDIQKYEYVWTKIKNVHYGYGSVGKIISSDSHGVDSEKKGIYCTADHRWVVKSNLQDVIGFSTSKNLPRNHKTLLQPRKVFPDNEKSILTKQQAFLFGWYLTDGFKTGRNKTFGLGINLIKKRSIDILEKYLLENDIPFTKSTYKRGIGIIHAFHVSCKVFDEIFHITEQKEPSEIVMGLSNEARSDMLLAMLEGDGSKRKNSNRYDRFGALEVQNKRTAEYFEILSMSTGNPYTHRIVKTHVSNKFVHYQLILGELYKNKNSKWNPEYECDVWCPETECGTWVVRQGHNIAVTGNSSNPNLQNIPTKKDNDSSLPLIRRAFIAPPGYKFVSIDYSQLELRVITHVSGEEHWIKAFANNEDIHASTAAAVNHKSIEEVTKYERKKAKFVNFGLLYGESAYGLSRREGMTEAEAQEFINEYFKVLPAIEEYVRSRKAMVVNLGYTETFNGRRLYFKFDKNDKKTVGAAQREGINFPIQGGASDIVKKAMYEVWCLLKPYKTKLSIQVHDELDFLMAEDEIDILVPKINDIMGNVFQLKVELKCDTEIGDNWNDIEDWIEQK